MGMAPYAGRRGRHPLRGGQGGGAGEGRTPHPSSALRETADATFPSRGRQEAGKALQGEAQNGGRESVPRLLKTEI